MSARQIVLDNSAVLPFYFPEDKNDKFDAGLVTNRSRALIQAVRLRKVEAFVPPSFFREFLNVASFPLFTPGGRTEDRVDTTRAQWEDLLSLPLRTVRFESIIGLAGSLVLDDGCPAADAWYLSAAIQTAATLWLSHKHRDEFFEVASRYVTVKLLCDEAPAYLKDSKF